MPAPVPASPQTAIPPASRRNRPAQNETPRRVVHRPAARCLWKAACSRAGIRDTPLLTESSPAEFSDTPCHLPRRGEESRGPLLRTAAPLLRLWPLPHTHAMVFAPLATIGPPPRLGRLPRGLVAGVTHPAQRCGNPYTKTLVGRMVQPSRDCDALPMFDRVDALLATSGRRLTQRVPAPAGLPNRLRPGGDRRMVDNPHIGAFVEVVVRELGFNEAEQAERERDELFGTLRSSLNSNRTPEWDAVLLRAPNKVSAADLWQPLLDAGLNETELMLLLAGYPSDRE
jgi:hypothetical protein